MPQPHDRERAPAVPLDTAAGTASPPALAGAGTDIYRQALCALGIAKGFRIYLLDEGNHEDCYDINDAMTATIVEKLDGIARGLDILVGDIEDNQRTARPNHGPIPAETGSRDPLLEQWRAAQATANEHGIDQPEFERRTAALREIEDRILDTPADTIRDLARKIELCREHMSGLGIYSDALLNDAGRILNIGASAVRSAQPDAAQAPPTHADGGETDPGAFAATPIESVEIDADTVARLEGTDAEKVAIRIAIGIMKLPKTDLIDGVHSLDETSDDIIGRFQESIATSRGRIELLSEAQSRIAAARAAATTKH